MPVQRAGVARGGHRRPSCPSAPVRASRCRHGDARHIPEAPRACPARRAHCPAMPGARRVPVRVLVAAGGGAGRSAPPPAPGSQPRPPPLALERRAEPRRAARPQRARRPPADPPPPASTASSAGSTPASGRPSWSWSGVPADGLTAGRRARRWPGRRRGDPHRRRRGRGLPRAGHGHVARGAATTARVPVHVATDQEGGTRPGPRGQPGSRASPRRRRRAATPAGLRADARGLGPGDGRRRRHASTSRPVADVVDPALGEDNAPVGALDRGFGTDPARGRPRRRPPSSRGWTQGGVATTLKHFPGLGRVRENTDFAGAVVDTTHHASTTRASPRSAPGIEAGAPVVMMSSAVYARIDPDNRALFSPHDRHRPAARRPRASTGW